MLCSVRRSPLLHTDFHLINPPPDAIHSPISPGNIVFAGDSAGGGLCVAALAVLRDLCLPMPAGAVLISPWVDLTHSFGSVMENTATVRVFPPLIRNTMLIVIEGHYSTSRLPGKALNTMADSPVASRWRKTNDGGNAQSSSGTGTLRCTET